MSCPASDFRDVQENPVPRHFSNKEFLEITSLFLWGLQTDSLLAWVEEEGSTPRAIHKSCPRGTEQLCNSAHGEWAPKWEKCHSSIRQFCQEWKERCNTPGSHLLGNQPHHLYFSACRLICGTRCQMGIKNEWERWKLWSALSRPSFVIHHCGNC